MRLNQPNLGHYFVHNCMLQVKGMNSDDIKILLASLNHLPSSLFKNTTTIYIFSPEEDLKSNFNSTFYNGIVTVNLKTVKDGEDLLKLVIHELFHSLEPEIKNENDPMFGVYQRVEQEYMTKKVALLTLLKNDPGVNKKPKPEYWKQIDFSNDFDNYLYSEVTYPVLQFKLENLFPSPYSITSLSEYMCVGLEIYLFENREWINNYCPELYDLLKTLVPMKQEIA